MSPADYAYNLVLIAAGGGVFRFLSRKTDAAPDFWRGRYGHYASDVLKKGSPRIWLHAASVGEVTGAVPTIHALGRAMPGACLFLTVGTPQGLRFAKSQLLDRVPVLPFPLDLPWVLKRAFHQLQPDLYVSFEGEFWPNLFRLLRRDAIPSVLLNGRISNRSAKRYELLRPLFEPVFKHFTSLAMHSEEDLANVLKLGAPAERTMVLGSSKYDGLLAKIRPEKTAEWLKLLRLSSDIPVVVGGSLRGSECTDLLEVFVNLRELEPGAVGIFAPRHLERIPEMVEWLNRRGIGFELLTRLERGEAKRRSAMVLVDRIGALFELYALGDLVFCGGTLEPIGGHNILEPAAWGKVVFYGPYLHKVAHENTILQGLEGSFLVQDARDLRHAWSYWIRHRTELKPYGENAREALSRLGGVVAKQVELITGALSR